VTIVAVAFDKGRVVIGGDRKSALGGAVSYTPGPKFIPRKVGRDSMILACTGRAALLAVLPRCTLPRPRRGDDAAACAVRIMKGSSAKWLLDAGGGASSILVLFRGTLAVIEGNGGVIDIEAADYTIGSGSPEAAGAMFAARSRGSPSSPSGTISGHNRGYSLNATGPTAPAAQSNRRRRPRPRGRRACARHLRQRALGRAGPRAGRSAPRRHQGRSSAETGRGHDVQ
jgi:ATP-dependent protease HslVU (ClpYQ) peptidase subunit